MVSRGSTAKRALGELVVLVLVALALSRLLPLGLSSSPPPPPSQQQQQQQQQPTRTGTGKGRGELVAGGGALSDASARRVERWVSFAGSGGEGAARETMVRAVVVVGEALTRLVNETEPCGDGRLSGEARTRCAASCAVPESRGCGLCARWRVEAGGESRMDPDAFAVSVALPLAAAEALLDPDAPPEALVRDVFSDASLDALRRSRSVVATPLDGSVVGGGGGFGLQVYCGTRLLVTLGGGGGFGSGWDSWGFGTGAGVQTPAWGLGGGSGSGGTARSRTSGYAADPPYGCADVEALRDDIRACYHQGLLRVEGGGGGSSDADSGAAAPSARRGPDSPNVGVWVRFSLDPLGCGPSTPSPSPPTTESDSDSVSAAAPTSLRGPS